MEAFEAFEEWEIKKRTIESTHLDITKNMIYRLEKKVEWIDNGVASIINFFKDRIIQEENYVKIMKHDLP